MESKLYAQESDCFFVQFNISVTFAGKILIGQYLGAITIQSASESDRIRVPVTWCSHSGHLK